MNPGDLIAGRYRLLRRVGAGAMSTVWAARHELLDREYAIKIAKLSPGSEAATRENFIREARIVSRLKHPNVVEIVDAGHIAGENDVYLAMELLEGQSLATRIAARAPLPAGEILAVLSEVCRGLSMAHGAGVVHRDIKPENIFLARAPTGGIIPKLLDFGVSSARGLATLGVATPLGTPAYMSPEEAVGKKTDHRADVWAVGVVMYEMLTGGLPFVADNYLALLPKIIEGPVPDLPEAIPDEICAIVHRCLEKDPALRYQSADDLQIAIDHATTALVAGEEAPASPSGFFVENGRTPVRWPVAPKTSSLPERGPSPQSAVLASAIALLAIAVVLLAVRGPGRHAPANGAPSPSFEPSAQPPNERLPGTTPAMTAATSAAIDPSASAGAATASRPAGSASALPAKAQPPGRGKHVTRVNNAGF